MKYFLVAVCLVTLMASGANAASTSSSGNPSNAPSSGLSTIDEKLPATSSVLDNFYADYFGVYHGPVLGNLSAPYSVNNQGNVTHKNATYFDSELTTAYLLDKHAGIGIGPDIPFWVTPVLGQGLTMGDAGIKAFDKKTIDTGDFRAYTNLYIQAPTSQYSSQVVHMKYGVKTTPYWWYHFRGSRFTIGSWNEMKDYVGVTSDKTFKLYSLPYVKYQLTPKLALNVGYEMEAHHNLNTPTFDFMSYETDLQPGLVWMISPQLIVNPYLQFFTGNRVTYDTTAIGTVITAALF